MLEERVIRATVNFFLKNLWRAVVLAAVFEHVICQSEQQCAGASSSCVQPVPKQQHNGKTLESLWLEVRCHLGCVDQVSVVDRNIKFCCWCKVSIASSFVALT